ncbi:hypothetical protein BGZ65_009840 [Modicella reniformis]|uniref:Cytosolic endo-beta-N-acetylglucosaminidase TIM barrel domain-containing protein n=1 Tax=Modicella reniformis TaxID=1440133 RepID=A0A9P6MLH9_9FUNG|nr:hypothetical protein BGZ65_009840 [Modicella reniformis]
MQSPPVPRSQPLKSFKEAFAWQPGQDEFNVSHTPLHLRPVPSNNVVAAENDALASSPMDCKVIVCHDMAGGYAEDALPQGNDYSTVYSVQYWNHIDVFIYFSHHRVTIPPPVWTNAAHRNGVRCLGNIITEWERDMFETDEMVSGPGQTLADENGKDIVDRRWFSKTYADKLVDMAVYYRFDGWFINIESDLRGGAQQAEQTIAFLAYLRAQIHARIPGGELIWYDSVISSTGEVRWQDRLTLENYKFFEQSDGIFINYTWKKDYVAESVALAGPRNRDVYTGIDIWGRNTYGGGKYTTYKALDIIQKGGTSCAVFAPAWTYESLGKDDFMTNDRFFWAGYRGAGIHSESLPLSSFDEATCRLLKGELGASPDDATKGKEEHKDKEDNSGFLPVSAYIPARPSGTSSWFYSNFDRGFGEGFWVNGKRVSDKPWSHLSHQSLSPLMTKEILVLEQDYSVRIPAPEGTIIRWVMSPEDAYNGGTSVVVQEFNLSESKPPVPQAPIPTPPPPPPETDNAHSRRKSILVPLFNTLISMPNAQMSTIELIYKPCQDSVHVGVHLGLLATGDPSRVARKVSKDKLQQALHPAFRAQIETTENESGGYFISNTPDPINKELFSLITLDAPEPMAIPEAALGVVSQQEQHHLHAVEILPDGWRRLILHLSNIFGSPEKLSSEDKTDLDMTSIAISQLGIILSYQEQTALKSSQVEESRSLVIIGSLAVVPTWSMQHAGSYVQGLESSDTQSILLERNTHLKVQGTPQQPLQQELDVLGGSTGDNQRYSISISISSTLKWNIGFPIDNPGRPLPSDTPVANSCVSTSEYSHFCVYVSLERIKGSKETIGDKNAEAEEGVVMFVGTAFTNRYRIAHFEVALEHGIATSNTEPSSDVSSKGVIPPTEMLQQHGQEIWAWVQGIRRDGRADEKRDWAKSRLL